MKLLALFSHLSRRLRALNFFAPPTDAGLARRAQTLAEPVLDMLGIEHNAAPRQGRMHLRRWGVAALALAISVVFSPAQAQVQRYIVNPSFELPALGGTACYQFTSSASVSGWSSTETTAASGGGGCTGQTSGANAIEIWRDNFNSVSAFEGIQHVELNAYSAARLSQPICMLTGDTVNWAYSHRARLNPGIVIDDANFSVGIPTNLVNVVHTNTNGVVSSTTADCRSSSSITNSICSSSTVRSWGRYTGSFTWQGSGGDQSVGFEATNGGSYGNFLDDVQFTVKPLIEFPSGKLPASPLDPPIYENAGTVSFQLRIAGRVPSGGIAVPLTITGSATGGGTDYTLASTFTVPAGDYAAGTTVNVPITLINDSLPEETKTVIITLAPPASSAAYRLGSTSICGGDGIGATTLSITDDDVSVTLNKTLAPVSDSGLFNLSITGGTPAPVGGTNPASNQGNGGSTGAVKVSPQATITLTETAGTSTSLSNYSTALSCVDGNTVSVLVTGSGTSRTITTPALTASAAARTITCTYTNTSTLPTIALKKALAGARIAVADQFTVDIRTGGVSGKVVNSITNSTTLGSGANVTAGSGNTGVYTGIAGTAYTLNEAMTSGSTSALTRYTRTLSCTNVGGTTNVSAFNSLPLTFSPVAGDNVVCTVTNTPAAAGVAGRVFLDNGVVSGTANDGVINGGEAGLSGITVRLTNCAATATVYASSTTDGTGAYSLAVPTSTATGATLCVEQSNQGIRISTGASVGNTALPSNFPTSVASSTYTYTRAGSPDRIAFTWNGTGHSGLNFGDVDTSTFATGGASTGQPGTTVSYSHIFTAGTSGSVSFSISAATSAPALTGWSEKIFADPGCTGTLQVGVVLLYPPTAAATSVAFGQKVCLIMQQYIPATGQISYSNDATVLANFSYSNASPALPVGSYTLHDITTVGNSVLELRKEVRNVTQGVLTFGINNQAKSGETLEYRIRYTNNASTPIRDLLVSDTTPVYTSFVSSNTGTTPATLTACTKNTPANPLPAPAVSCAAAQPVGSTGAVGWKFTGSLNPSDTGDVLFQVKVD